MKSKLLSNVLLFGSLLFLFQGCMKDKCTVVDTYIKYTPVYMTYDDLRSSVAVEPVHNLEDAGKIYIYGSYLFINDVDKGIHIYDNTNPINPTGISFLKIPGNNDLAVKGSYLYADSYVDLVIFDISNPSTASLVKRVEDVFPQRTFNGSWHQTKDGHVIVDFVEEEVTESSNIDCGGGFWRNEFAFSTGLENSTTDLVSNSTGQPNTTGIGGSMARFTIMSNYLYVVDNSTMHLFDLSDPSCPTFSSQVPLGWNIETIFPYQDKLFIGSTTGMHIYDNSDPANPSHISTYQHVSSCDPVIVKNDLAYVTLRSGNPCEGFVNQLDVVDISNLSNPSRIATHQMHNPHGLGIDNSTLFLCDGDDGLKVFDVTDVQKIGENLLDHIKNIHTFDVIAFNNRLLVIGEDGFYQYDYTNAENLQFLSKIAVN